MMANATPPNTERSRPRGAGGAPPIQKSTVEVRQGRRGKARAHYSGGQPRPSSDRVRGALLLLPETHASDDAVTADPGCDHACGGAYMAPPMISLSQ